MGKNNETGRHEVASEYYLGVRGKRLPWVRYVIQNTKDIYTRVDKNDREIMYVGVFTRGAGEPSDYMMVIVRKHKKDKTTPYVFKTAFSNRKSNAFLKRLERYTPITDVQEARAN